MHQLGAVNKASADEKVKRVLSARRSFYNAAAALLECDDAYAARIKTELERLKIARYFRPFAGIPYLREVTADEIQSYLETARRVVSRNGAPDLSSAGADRNRCEKEAVPGRAQSARHGKYTARG